MADIQISVAVPKELNDVLGALVGLALAIKAGKSLSDLAAQELPILIGIIGEFSQIPEELQSELGPSLDAALLQVRRLIFQLVAK